MFRIRAHEPDTDYDDPAAPRWACPKAWDHLALIVLSQSGDPHACQHTVARTAAILVQIIADTHPFLTTHPVELPVTVTAQPGNDAETIAITAECEYLSSGTAHGTISIADFADALRKTRSGGDAVGIAVCEAINTYHQSTTAA